MNSAIRLQWKWPKDCQEVRISYSERDYPQLNDDTVPTYDVSRVEYDYKGYYAIQATINQTYYIVVSAILVENGEKIPALGTRLEAQLVNKTILTYEIKHSNFRQNKRKLHIKTNSSRSLPDMLLISKRNGLPISKIDGDQFKYIESSVVNSKELVIDLPDDQLPSHTFCKLFLEEDSLYREFTIHHPHEDKLRLS